MTTTDPKQRSIDLLESELASGKTAYSPWVLFSELRDRAQREQWSFDWRATLEHWGELQRIGAIVVLSGDPGNMVYSGRPVYLVTERGKRILARNEASPHDTDRYITSLRRRVGTPDPVALDYLREAVGAWQGALYRASVVMLGCACERIVLLLAAHVRTVDIAPFSDKLAKLLDSGRPVNVSDVFTLVRDALVAAAEDKRLPGELGPDIVDRRLTPVFERARGLRNKSGHPTGAEVHAEEAEAGLLLFPDFHEFATRVLAELKSKGA